MKYSDLFLQYCESIGLRLTSLRKMVLFILWKAEKPLKAYDLLEKLLPNNPHIKPPAVYRSLEYFVNASVVHKIESMQSYVLCSAPEHKEAAEIVMVCQHCHRIQEVYDLTLHEALMRLTETYHFSLGTEIIELKGQCGSCKKYNNHH